MRVNGLAFSIMMFQRTSAVLFFVLVGSFCRAQVTLIADAVFEQLLIEAGLDEYPLNGEVETASIDTVTALDLYTSGSTNVTDLSGIEDFAALAYLMVNFSDLTALDLSQNMALQEVRAYDNDISNLILPATESLTYLELAGNPIGVLDVTENPSLVYLSCSYGGLDVLDLTHNPVLEHLACMFNNLEALDVSQNPMLQVLYCGQNAISALDLSNNPQLTTVSCTANALPLLDVSLQVDLETLACNDNQLTELDISNNNALTWLDCSFNQIADLDASLHPLMVELFCHHNELVSLALSAALIGIDCDHNQLEYLDVSGVENLFYSFDCSFNPMTCIQVNESQFADVPLNWISDTEDVFSIDCEAAFVLASEVKSGLFLFPNPVSDCTWLRGLLEGNRYAVYDVNGRVVLSGIASLGDNLLDFSGLPEGVYVLNAGFGKQTKIQVRKR